MKQRTQVNVVYIIFAILGVLTLQNVWIQYRTIEPLAYSDFLRQLKAGNVQDAGGVGMILFMSAFFVKPSGSGDPSAASTSRN